jgi:uncharacterized protein (TIGR00251 family)
VSGFLRDHPDGTLLLARVSPKASADRLGPEHDGRLKIAVTSAPEKGKATAHVVKLLAKKLGLPKSAVQVIAGEIDRDKTVLLKGLSPAETRARLGV